jgi:hypothetical protein
VFICGGGSSASLPCAQATSYTSFSHQPSHSFPAAVYSSSQGLEFGVVHPWVAVGSSVLRSWICVIQQVSAAFSLSLLEGGRSFQSY